MYAAIIHIVDTKAPLIIRKLLILAQFNLIFMLSWEVKLNRFTATGTHVCLELD